MMGGRKITLLDEAFLGWGAIFSTRILTACSEIHAYARLLEEANCQQ
jgi:hypothetical protein